MWNSKKKIKESWQPHQKGCCFLHPQSCLVINVGHGIDRATFFFFFFQLLIKTSKQISIDTSGKSALKVGNVPSFKVICPKRARMVLHRVAKYTDVCMVEARTCLDLWLLLLTLSLPLLFLLFCFAVHGVNYWTKWKRPTVWEQARTYPAVFWVKPRHRHPKSKGY